MILSHILGTGKSDDNIRLTNDEMSFICELSNLCSDINIMQNAHDEYDDRFSNEDLNNVKRLIHCIRKEFACEIESMETSYEVTQEAYDAIQKDLEFAEQEANVYRSITSECSDKAYHLRGLKHALTVDHEGTITVTKYDLNHLLKYYKDALKSPQESVYKMKKRNVLITPFALAPEPIIRVEDKDTGGYDDFGIEDEVSIYFDDGESECGEIIAITEGHVNLYIKGMSAVVAIPYWGVADVLSWQ